MRDYEELQRAGQAARLEKLLENTHKPGFDHVTVAYALQRCKQELDELVLEVHVNGADPEKIRREFADLGNFADMDVLACDREISKRITGVH